MSSTEEKHSATAEEEEKKATESAADEKAAGEKPEAEAQGSDSRINSETADNKEKDASSKEEKSEGSAASDQTDEKSFSKHQMKKELEKKDAKIKDLTDRYQRTLAEYQNFRTRSEKEKSDMYGFAVRDVMEKILPVLDNLKRGLEQIPEESKDDAFAKGMMQLQKQFEKALDDIGVKPIEAVGKEFDPNLHNAVMHVDDDSVGENIVVQEFQTGYTYKGTVVRHSMVQVAN